MRAQIRNWASIVIAVLSIALAVSRVLAPPMAFTGITLRAEGSVLVVDGVDPASALYGTIRPGDIVHDVNYASIGDIPPKVQEQYRRGDFLELGFDDPAGGVIQYTFPPRIDGGPAAVFLIGVGLLFGIAVWVGRGQAGQALRPLALPLAVAVSTPLILLPISGYPHGPVILGGMTLATGALLLLSDGFVERISERRRRRGAVALTLAAAAGYAAATIGVAAFVTSGVPIPILGELRTTLTAAITVIPAGILVTGRRAGALSGHAAGPSSPDRVPILLAALTPVVVGPAFTYSEVGFGLNVPLIWLLVVVVVLQANARTETLRIQRDTVVAATEAERARLAADLHDDALQEMTVLLRRLDDAGDRGGAELARSIADRLRDVCGELRLPILDELGAGSALEWLVERVGDSSGRSVSLMRDDPERPPALVELAVFRVAQEALANAVTHGAPPIVVHYSAAAGRVSLQITDHGSGIAAGAAAEAGRSGHYGLLNMRQRAEQIGGTIDVRRPPGGGTSIGLRWSSA
jgi:signal transduction histidine kinase